MTCGSCLKRSPAASNAACLSADHLPNACSSGSLGGSSRAVWCHETGKRRLNLRAFVICFRQARTHGCQTFSEALLEGPAGETQLVHQIES